MSPAEPPAGATGLARIPPASADSYRSRFAAAALAEEYESNYAPGTYDSWIWDLQRSYLEDLLARRLPADGGRYLDFACGSGRVISFVEPKVREAIGVDVSPHMLELAREKVERAALIHTDLTADRGAVTGKFDLITAFRFLLHSEPELRSAALTTIRDLIADDGTLVVNVHGNAHSLRAIPWAFRRYILRQGVKQLSLRQTRAILEQSGFRVVEARGFGLVIARLYRLLGRRLSEMIERATRFRPIERLCVDLILVCEPKSEARSRPGG